MNYMVINILGETISHQVSSVLFNTHFSEHITLFGPSDLDQDAKSLIASQATDLLRKNYEDNIVKIQNEVVATSPKFVFVYVVCVNNYVLDAITALRKVLGDRMRLYTITSELRVRPLVIVEVPKIELDYSKFYEVLEMHYINVVTDVYAQRINAFGECEMFVPGVLELTCSTTLDSNDPVYRWLNDRWRISLKNPKQKQRTLQLLD